MKPQIITTYVDLSKGVIANRANFIERYLATLEAILQRTNKLLRILLEIPTSQDAQIPVAYRDYYK